MPQGFQVLKCFSCATFQVHQQKKSNKWNCKLCGEKQSIKRIYGSGSGHDCRKHTQKLNMVQGEQEHEKNVAEQNLKKPDCNYGTCSLEMEQPKCRTTEGSKWSQYIDCDIENVEDNTVINKSQYTTSKQEFCTALKAKRKSHSDGKSSRHYQPYKVSNKRFDTRENPCKAKERMTSTMPESDIINTNMGTNSENSKSRYLSSNSTNQTLNGTNNNMKGNCVYLKRNSVSAKSKWNQFVEENTEEPECNYEDENDSSDLTDAINPHQVEEKRKDTVHGIEPTQSPFASKNTSRSSIAFSVDDKELDDLIKIL